MGTQPRRSVWRRLELALWALVAPIASCNPGGGGKYGPGPTIDCDPFTARVASVQVTPASAHPGETLVVTASVSRAPDEQVVGVAYWLDHSLAVTTEMRDDGVAPDLVSGDGTFTGTGAAPAPGTRAVTVGATVVKEGFPDECSFSASTDVDVTE